MMIKPLDTGSNNERQATVTEPSSSWGGAWTEEKLNAFEKYVNAYLTIMNKHRDQNDWKLIYFDGFAGSGSRQETAPEEDNQLMMDLLNEHHVTTDELSPYKGAAERVLNISQKGFDYYYFIDKDQASSRQLEEKLSPIRGNRQLVFRHSDANKQVSELANAMHNNSDLWILIPTGVIVNRLLDRKCKLTHIEKLTTFFGKDESFLKEYFYNTRQDSTLFGEVEVVEKVGEPINRITELYIQQMKTIFKYVTEQPLVLRNTRNTPIFHFACASNNQSAVKIAHEIINK